MRLAPLCVSLLLVACSTSNVRRDEPPTATRPTSGSEADVHAEVDALIAAGKLVPLAGADVARQLDVAKASAYSDLPFALRRSGLVRAERDADVEIYVFSIGQADAMLIVGPPPARRTLLVDVGETNWNTRKGCLHVRDRVKAITDRHHVDYLLLSHYHLDHAGYPPMRDQRGKVFEGGGLFCLMGSTPEFFTVGTLIDSGRIADRLLASSRAILDGIDAGAPHWIAAGTLQSRESARFGTGQIDLGEGVEVDIVVTGGRVAEGDPGAHEAVETAEPDTYSPGQPASYNDFSVGMELSAGDFELFTAGDLTGAAGEPPYASHEIKSFGTQSQVYTNVESPLAAHWADSGRESAVEIYRANHHGSENSSTRDLLDLLQPNVVIYSCGGEHGHPSPAIARRMFELGADQLVTTRPDRPDGVFQDDPDIDYGQGWENPVGEIKIIVPLAGGEYTISSATQAWSYPIQDDATEAAQAPH